MDQRAPPPGTPCGAARDSAQTQARLEQQVRRQSDELETLTGRLERAQERRKEAEDESIKKSGELAAAQTLIAQKTKEVAELNARLAAEKLLVGQKDELFNQIASSVAQFATFVREFAKTNKDGNPSLAETISKYDAAINADGLTTMSLMSAHLVGTKSMLMAFKSDDNAAVLARYTELEAKFETLKEEGAKALRKAGEENETLRKRLREMAWKRRRNKNLAWDLLDVGNSVEEEVHHAMSKLRKTLREVRNDISSDEDGNSEDDDGDGGPDVGEKRPRSGASRSGSPPLRPASQFGALAKEDSAQAVVNAPPTPGEGEEGGGSVPAAAAAADAAPEAAALEAAADMGGVSVAAAMGYLSGEEAPQGGAGARNPTGKGKEAVHSEKLAVLSQLELLACGALPFTSDGKWELASLQLHGFPAYLMAVSPLTDSANKKYHQADKYTWHFALFGRWATGDNPIAYAGDEVKKQFDLNLGYWKRITIIGSAKQLADCQNLRWSSNVGKQTWNDAQVRAMGAGVIYEDRVPDEVLIFRSRAKEGKPSTFFFYKKSSGKDAGSGASSSSSGNPGPAAAAAASLLPAAAAAAATPLLPAASTTVKTVRLGSVGRDAVLEHMVTGSSRNGDSVWGYGLPAATHDGILEAVSTNAFEVGTSIEFAPDHDAHLLPVVLNKVLGNTRIEIPNRSKRLVRTTAVLVIKRAMRTNADHVVLDLQGIFRKFNVEDPSARDFQAMTFEDVMKCVGHLVPVPTRTGGEQGMYLIKNARPGQTDEIFAQHEVIAAKVLVKLDQFTKMVMSSPTEAGSAATPTTNFRYVKTTPQVTDSWKQASLLEGSVRAIFDEDDQFQGILQDFNGSRTFRFGHTNPHYHSRLLPLGQ